jgi:hypothetical protein
LTLSHYVAGVIRASGELMTYLHNLALTAAWILAVWGGFQLLAFLILASAPGSNKKLIRSALIEGTISLLIAVPYLVTELR